MSSSCRPVSPDSADTGLTCRVSGLSARVEQKATMTLRPMRLVHFALAMALAVLPARADDDHDTAHAALSRGDVLALSQILPGLEAQLDARLIDAELEDEHGRLVYELVMITSDGRRIDVLVDAATGEMFGEAQAGEDAQGNRRTGPARGLAPQRGGPRGGDDGDREGDDD